jgi:hypothetical protein
VLAGTGPLCCVEILVEAAGEQQDHEAAPAVPTGKAQDQAPPPALPEAEDDLPMLDQVELLQQSLEGRKRLREHLERQRDPRLVQLFKSQLSSFLCSVCKFDFEECLRPNWARLY